MFLKAYVYIYSYMHLTIYINSASIPLIFVNFFIFHFTPKEKKFNIYWTLIKKCILKYLGVSILTVFNLLRYAPENKVDKYMDRSMSIHTGDKARMATY